MKIKVPKLMVMELQTAIRTAGALMWANAFIGLFLLNKTFKEIATLLTFGFCVMFISSLSLKKGVEK